MSSRRTGPIRPAAALAALLLVAAACATPANLAEIEKTPSHALAQDADGALLRPFAAELAAHPGQSGFLLVPRGEWGFTIRAGLALAAQHTLDLQYYIWHPDTTGKLLAERLIRAADRGVRVRLLVDDLQTAGRDYSIAMIDSHPNIDVRLFNPVTLRKRAGAEFLSDFTRLNRRMHNKTFIADNAMAVVGGRNLGDEYFGVNPEVNFRDLDLLAVGPIVADVSDSFDTYWNSIWAIPLERLVKDWPEEEEVAAADVELRDWVSGLSDFPYPIDASQEQLLARLEQRREAFIWGAAEVLSDPPEKGASQPIDAGLRRAAGDVQDEILIEMSYFIPGEDGIAAARRLRDQGVRLRVLTNSLASNDVVAAQAGYARYRVPLLQAGVELYELRPDPEARRLATAQQTRDAHAALHTKAAVIDRRVVWIGSYNFDPRSRDINTEIGILVHSEELARLVGDFMDAGVRPGNAYRLELAGGDGPLTWSTVDDGAAVRYASEQRTGVWRQMQQWLLSLLPIESQL